MIAPIIATIAISALIFSLGFIPTDLLSLWDDGGREGRVLGAQESVFEVGKISAIEEKNIWDGLIVKSPEEVGNKIAGVAEDVVQFALGREDDEIVVLPENANANLPPIALNKEDMGEISAKSAVVFDSKSGKMLFSKNSGEELPIASITKLMTALVFLDNNPGWDKVYKMQEEDRRDGGKIYLWKGEEVTVEDLFYLALVGSANTATMALVSSTGMSEKEFVFKMNEKASALGLNKTNFNDVAGLSRWNTSTAFELSKLARVAFSNFNIRKATLTSQYEFNTVGGKRKIVKNTDYLLDNFNDEGVNMIGGKTGYTDLAGYCFVGEFINEDNNEVVSVVLGSRSISSRFTESAELARWTYRNYEWQ